MVDDGYAPLDDLKQFWNFWNEIANILLPLGISGPHFAEDIVLICYKMRTDDQFLLPLWIVEISDMNLSAKASLAELWRRVKLRNSDL